MNQVTSRNGHIKLNTDAGYQNIDSWRFGIYFRNDSGSIVFAASKHTCGRFSPEIVEALVVCWALQLDQVHGFKYVEVETERVFNMQRGSTPLDMMAMDVQFLFESFEFFSLNHISREANKVSHYLAKYNGELNVKYSSLTLLNSLLHLPNIDYKFLLI